MSGQFNAMKTECESKADTIIIAGSARLPENAAAKQISGCLVIELEINRADSVIMDVSCTLPPSLAGKMLRKELLGSKIDEGINNTIKRVEEGFSGAIKKAIIAALEDVRQRYKKFREEINSS